MKRLLALMLAAALALSLVACGGGNGAGDTNTSSTGNGDTTSTDTPSMTKEEMLETAEDGNISELHHLIAENILSAKQAYCGKVLTFRGNIYGIKEDYITFNHGKGSIIVYLPAEDIVNLKTDQWVTIIGLTNDEFITTKESRGGEPTSDYTDCIMEQAYLVTDRYEYTGIPKNENNSHPGAWDVEFPDSNNPAYLRLVYFDDSIDVSQYVGKEITFSAKAIDGDYFESAFVDYIDAIIIE